LPSIKNLFGTIAQLLFSEDIFSKYYLVRPKMAIFHKIKIRKKEKYSKSWGIFKK